MNLLERLLQHARATAEFSVYFGKGRDTYDVRGRTAHESLFNAANGTYRGPSSQQGYSPFSTWTRGLAWAMLGFAEQLEFLETIDPAELARIYENRTKRGLTLFMRRRWRRATFTSITRPRPMAFRIGIPARQDLRRLATGSARAADPFNDHEPVDSSAAAIAAQGLLRLARVAAARGGDGKRYEQAGLRVLDTLIDETGPYLSRDGRHQGLLLHSIYHRPNGWDHVPAGSRIPRGESSMWGDYHLREAALLREAHRGRRRVFHVLWWLMMRRDSKQTSQYTSASCARRTGGTRGIGLGHRARARARRVDARVVRPALARTGRGRGERARLAGRRGRVLARRHRQPERPRAIAPVDRRALRNAARAREQRRPRAARARRSACGDGGELRGSAAHQSAGPVLSDAGGRAAARSATGGETRAARDCVRDVGVGRDGVAAARRVLCEQGGPLDGGQIVCRSPRARSAFRCTRCGPASSPRT